MGGGFVFGGRGGGGPESGGSRQGRWADKEKRSVSSGAGCGGSGGVRDAGKPASQFGSVSSGARRGVAREVGGAVRPARANKEKSSVCGTVGSEVSRCVRGAANVKVMETHVVRRPVKGGPAQIGLIKMTMKLNRVGGPGVQRTPGRRPPHRNGGTFGSFSHERTT